MNNPFRRFFEEEQEDVDLTDCHQILDLARCDAFETFIMAYLERGCDAKINTSSNASMLASSERINTYKDIRAYYRGQVRQAREILDRESSSDA